MKKLLTYTYRYKGIIAKISNRKTYWFLDIYSNKTIIIISEDRKIWNTKKAALNYVKKIFKQYEKK